MLNRVVSCCVLVGMLTACGGSDGDSSAANETTTTEKATTTTTKRTTTTTATTTTTTEPPPEGHTELLEDPAGWSWELTIVEAEASPDGSDGGCVETAPPGSTNLHLTITIENLADDREAPVPELVFDLNLNADGSAVDPAAVTLPDTSYDGDGELTPNSPDTTCFLASGITNDAVSIPAGRSEDFQLVFGPVSDPVPDGVALMGRHFADFDMQSEMVVPLAELFVDS